MKANKWHKVSFLIKVDSTIPNKRIDSIIYNAFREAAPKNGVKLTYIDQLKIVKER